LAENFQAFGTIHETQTHPLPRARFERQPANSLIMKTLLFLIAFIVIPLSTYAAVETNGFLVFEVERYASTEGHTGGSDIKQKFKVPLTEAFILNFKRVESQSSMGTEFYCSGGNLTNGQGGTRFIWWIHKTADGCWSIRMWGMGFEAIDGIQLNSENPNTTQCLTIKRWEDLDMSYRLNYVNKYDGIGVSFGAKYMSAKDVQAEGFIPTAPVKKADHSDLFKGDVLTNCPIIFGCAFQED
jgi:hypothetical protein